MLLAARLPSQIDIVLCNLLNDRRHNTQCFDDERVDTQHENLHCILSSEDTPLARGAEDGSRIRRTGGGFAEPATRSVVLEASEHRGRINIRSEPAPRPQILTAHGSPQRCLGFGFGFGFGFGDGDGDGDGDGFGFGLGHGFR
jgi:hypothetical protein